jgi:pyrimidine deaminase RibD-like protein
MQLALNEARKSVPRTDTFCVGAAIFAPSQQRLSTGYSRELPTGSEGELHAEHCAIVKLQQRLGLDGATAAMRGASIYSTMEPCSVRTSGSRPCADRLIEHGFGAVYLGVQEPGDFVVCEGVDRLQKSGIPVIAVEGLEQQCLDVARGTA